MAFTMPTRRLRIAEAIGFSQPAVAKFVTFITNAEVSVSDKSPETDEEGEEDANALGHYETPAASRDSL